MLRLAKECWIEGEEKRLELHCFVRDLLLTVRNREERMRLNHDQGVLMRGH